MRRRGLSSTSTIRSTDRVNWLSPWQNPGAYQQASSSAFSQAGNGMAWRDTTTVDHEIEIPAYKLDGGGGENSIGGVVAGLTNANNFVGYELVKTGPSGPAGAESKSVMYVKVDGTETTLDSKLHPELTLGTFLQPAAGQGRPGRQRVLQRRYHPGPSEDPHGRSGRGVGRYERRSGEPLRAEPAQRRARDQVRGTADRRSRRPRPHRPRRRRRQSHRRRRVRRHRRPHRRRPSRRSRRSRSPRRRTTSRRVRTCAR